MKIDNKQKIILKLLQSNGRLTSKEIAERIDVPVTTAFARIKKMEENGIIKKYKAVLDARQLGSPATAFIFASFSQPASQEGSETQKRIESQIAKHSMVQEVHTITGDWDMIIKVKGKDVDDMSNFVMNNLRTMNGIEKTLTCIVFRTAKESTDIAV
jgi:DNA-binding Lrp family transcriptional regulator